MTLSQWFHRWGSPKWFYQTTTPWMPWLGVVALGLWLWATGWGLAFSPPDYQQGDSVRIIYWHVPAAFFSLSVYVAMAMASAVGLIWRMKLAFMVARACAPIGAMLTALALFTGAVWGKPMWGTWWVWDARLTSELVLLFLYLGVMALQQAFSNRDTADRASAILAIVGVVNIPIIHFSVEWWHTLHQGATLSKFAKPSMDVSMLWPLFCSLAAFAVGIVWLILLRTHHQILQREAQSHWLKESLKS